MNPAAQLAGELIHARQTILPKRLQAPGPDATQLDQILQAAGAAPDHRQLLPWRFVIVPQDARPALGEAFVQSLMERDPAALPEQAAQAREKAFRAPVLLLAVVRVRDDDPSISADERVLSAGCAVQNMLLMATALGFGSALTSGKALQSHGLRRLFGLTANEAALCFVNLGTALQRRPARIRPAVSAYVSTLAPGTGAT